MNSNAISDMLEPGSTFKTASIMVALEDGKITQMCIRDRYRLCVPCSASSSCSILKAIGSLISTSPSYTYAMAPSSVTAANG